MICGNQLINFKGGYQLTNFKKLLHAML